MSLLAGISKAGSKFLNLTRYGILREWSGLKILTTARDLGYKIRTQTFYQDKRLLEGILKKWSTIRNVTKGNVPGISHYFSTVTPMKTAFQTVIQFSGYDTVTGETFTKRTTVGHDKLITVGELEEKALEEKSADYPTEKVTDIMPIEARKGPDVAASYAEYLADQPYTYEDYLLEAEYLHTNVEIDYFG